MQKRSLFVIFCYLEGGSYQVTPCIKVALLSLKINLYKKNIVDHF